ncbi:MAG: hypothetical protein JEZ11_14640 [Desulfobacterales bacterium]|nr:hypothetical protein [Desulfobacterales bacterium]
MILQYCTTPSRTHQTGPAAWGWRRNVRRGAVIVAGWIAIMATGCARLEETSSVDAVHGDADTHAGFVIRNMAMLNRLYAEGYEPKPFVVDLDGGSAPIQTLIRPKAISAATGRLGLSGLSSARQVNRLHQYVLSNYAFVPEPLAWRPPEETVSLGRGDCKNLSLLLISLLASAGLEARGAISHGHMWVEVRVEDHWRILELDGDQEWGRIYRIPGFYDLPLYRIYPDRSEKRRRLAVPR